MKVYTDTEALYFDKEKRLKKGLGKELSFLKTLKTPRFHLILLKLSSLIRAAPISRPTHAGFASDAAAPV